MTKKILIIQGHPDEESFSNALAEAYQQGASKSSAEIKEIKIRDLDFDIVLKYGYRKRTELEPDLLDAQEKIQWADHLVWVYPVWWGSIPALMKGFIDRTFLPGFAFKYRENSPWWDKLLTGRTARLICTLDQPAWYYKWVYGQPSHNAMKKLTMHFMGIKPVKITTLGPIKNSSDQKRKQWIAKVEKLGEKLA